MKRTTKLLLSSIAIAAAASAGAAEVVIDPAVTVNLAGWTYGSGNAVNVGTPTYSGQAGGFSGALSNAGPYDNASFATYCVELGQTFSFGVTYNDYKIIKGDTYGLWANNPTTAGQIGQLMTYVGTLGPLSSMQSTGVQMAIWELVYETQNSRNGGYSLDTGSFTNIPSTPNTFGNSLLSAFSATTSLYSVDVLENANHQDFLILTAVPEPEGYALAFAGLACIGLFGRKFRAAKKA